MPGGAERCLLRGHAQAQPLPRVAALEDEKSHGAEPPPPRGAAEGSWQVERPGAQFPIKKPHVSRLR